MGGGMWKYIIHLELSYSKQVVEENSLIRLMKLILNYA
jgi:hypothetical protein